MRLFDTVALVEDVPALKLYSGQVGTIVEEYEPNVFEIEFSVWKASQLTLLQYQCLSERKTA
ncbi:MAG: DUF4926 domain-containing protein [Candidatus Poribacteria bacterium]|nr:DUF4926 domain-containing protein [Candidatus Poribacteria bacterium]